MRVHVSSNVVNPPRNSSSDLFSRIFPVWRCLLALKHHSFPCHLFIPFYTLLIPSLMRVKRKERERNSADHSRLSFDFDRTVRFGFVLLFPAKQQSWVCKNNNNNTLSIYTHLQTKLHIYNISVCVYVFCLCIYCNIRLFTVQIRYN